MSSPQNTPPTPAHPLAGPVAEPYPLTMLPLGSETTPKGVADHEDARTLRADTPIPPQKKLFVDTADIHPKRKMDSLEAPPKRARIAPCLAPCLNVNGLRVDTSLAPTAESLPAPRNKRKPVYPDPFADEMCDTLLRWRKKAAPQSIADEVAYRRYDTLARRARTLENAKKLNMAALFSAAYAGPTHFNAIRHTV